MTYSVKLKGAGTIKAFGLSATPTFRLDMHDEIEYVQSTEAYLEISYNFSKLFYETLDHENGIHWLNGQKAVDTLTTLLSATLKLGTAASSDPFEPVPGNAGFILMVLLSWALQYPQCIWEIN